MVTEGRGVLMKPKSYVIGAIASLAMVVGMSVPAFAAPGNDGTPPPGQAQAGVAGAQCGTGAASGAFGAFAHGYIPANYPTPRAANGPATGDNNSDVCGSAQGNP